MTYFWVIAALIFINFSFFFILWNNFSNTSISPKYLNSSYDSNLKNEVNSALLNLIGNSFQKMINKKPLFAAKATENEDKSNLENIGKIVTRKKLTEKCQKSFVKMLLLRMRSFDNFKQKIEADAKLKQKEKKKEEERNTIKFTENNKVSMFLDDKRQNVFVLKVSNDEEIFHKYSYEGKRSNNEKNLKNSVGEVSLFSIPIKEFLSSKYSSYSKNENLIFKSNKEKAKYILDKFLQRNNVNNDNNESNESYSSNSKSRKIRICFSSKFLGKIIGVVSSNNKKIFAITYEIKTAKTSSSYYRIRYFHNIQALCDKQDKQENHQMLNLLKYENKIINNFYKVQQENHKIKENDSNNYNFNRIYYETTSEIVHNEKTKISLMNNFFSDKFYDDFSLGLNYPVKAMAIKKDLLAFAIDSQLFEFTILKRENCSLTNKALWKVFSHGPVIDKTEYKFFHTNSLKFMNEQGAANEDDSKEIYNLIQITTSIKIKNNSNNTSNSKEEANNKFAEVRSTGVIRKIKKIDFSKFFWNENKEVSYLHEELGRKINKGSNSIKFYEVDFIKDAIKSSDMSLETAEKVNLAYCEYKQQENIFDVKNCLKNFRSYLRPTLFSNNNINYNSANENKDSFVIEFRKGEMLLLESNLNRRNLNLMVINPENRSKAERIYSDSQNKNMLIKYENDENFTYIIREEIIEKCRNHQQTKQYVEIKKEISTKDINFPKLYKHQKPMAFLFEKINNKSIAIFIDEKGIIHSLDFTEFRNKLINKTKPFNLFKTETYSNNINWDILKYILILCLAYQLLYSNSISNTEEYHSNSTNENNNEYNDDNSEEENEAAAEALLNQEQKAKEEEISQLVKKLLEQINELISKNNMEEKENKNLRSKIIEMIEKAEMFIVTLNRSFVAASELLEEMESVKSKLFMEENIEEKDFILEEDLKNSKKDFDEVSRTSYTCSDISESTTNQSDSDDFHFSFETRRSKAKAAFPGKKNWNRGHIQNQQQNNYNFRGFFIEEK